MITYKIDFDLSELKKLAENNIKGMTTAALPNTDVAVAKAAQKVRQMWIGYLDGTVQLPGVDTPDKVTSAMVRSIRTEDKTNAEEFHYSITSDNRQLEQLNNGSKAVEYDMKLTHPYGKKSRVSKKGIPYLIIPFRWGTPNQKGKKRAHFNNFIPQKNYETNVKSLELSAVNELKKYFENNYKGESIQRQGYDWAKNGRLTEDQAWEVVGRNGNVYTSAGMVRMKDVTGSSYFTFRIVSAKSPANSWIYKKKAVNAANYIQALENAARPEVEKIIEQGLKADEQFYKNLR